MPFPSCRAVRRIVAAVAVVAAAGPGHTVLHGRAHVTASESRGAGRVSEATPTADLSPSDWSSIRQAYERHRHRVVPVPGEPQAWRARNAGQQWVTRFDGHGFLVQPDRGGWTWGLDLRRYGIQGSEQAVASAAQVRVDAERVTYAWDARVDEWFVNEGRGLEHGFTVRERPAGGPGPVTLELGVRGGLRPRVQGDGRAVAFLDASQAAVVTYAGLTVFDADGAALPARFEGAGTAVRLVVQDDEARYPLTIDPLAQQAYLKASNTGASDYFGWSVAVSGDTVVVGAYGEDSNTPGVDGDQANDDAPDAGAAYVFVRDGLGAWSQQAYLKASNTGDADYFGYSVSVSGDTVVVGAYGEDSNATGVDVDQANDDAPDAGAAYVFVRSGVVWNQQAYLKASNTEGSDYFGVSVAVSGDTVVVGAPQESSNAMGVNGNQADNNAPAAGAAYVFVRSGVVWSQEAYLKASNTGASDDFGYSVAASGDTVVAGAYGESSTATGVDHDQTNDDASAAGAAYVFVRNGLGVWSQQAYLKASNTGDFDYFGTSVAVSGDTVVVGAYGEDSNATGVDDDQANDGALDAGAAYVFVRSGGVWNQQAYLKASNTEESDYFGVSVAVSGDTVVVGAYEEDSNATGVDHDQTNDDASGAGAGYVFVRDAGVWSQQAYLKASSTSSGDYFGWSVAVSGDTVVVGAYGEDSNATGVDQDPTNDDAPDAGAAYVFVPSAGTTGTITVHKTVDAGGASPTSFCFTLSPDPGSLDPGTGQVCATGAGDAVFSNVPAGTYSATETTFPADYHEVSSTCTGLVILGQDDSLTCDVHNAINTGTITVHKTVDAGGAPSTAFCFTLSPDPGHGQVCATGAGDAVFAGVPAGTYSAIETLSPATYHQVSSTCAGMAIATQGDSRTCDVHDTINTGIITVHKVLDAGGAPLTAFCFTLSPDPGTGQVCATGAGDAVFAGVPAGTYSAIETLSPATYYQVSNTCAGVVIAAQGDSRTCAVHDSIALKPKIAIDKQGPTLVQAGQPATYTYVVKNIGNAPLTKVSVTDTKCAAPAYASGDGGAPGVLDVGESWTFTCTYTPTFTPTSALKNRATATAKLGATVVSASDTYTLYPFTVKKVIYVMSRGRKVPQPTDPASFTVGVYKNGNLLQSFTVSQSAPLRVWLDGGNFTFKELKVPAGYIPDGTVYVSTRDGCGTTGTLWNKRT